MADSGQVVKIALLAGGGYLLYRALSGSTSTGIPLTSLATAVAAAPASTAPAASAPPAATPAALPVLAVQDLLNAAGKTATDLLTSDQWNYFRNQLRPPDLTGAQLASAIPSGAAPMTAADFVSKLHAVGLGSLNGFQIAVPRPVGVVRSPGGRPAILFALNHGRRGY